MSDVSVRHAGSKDFNSYCSDYQIRTEKPIEGHNFLSGGGILKANMEKLTVRL
jgi:hypothetical protein